jgi:hypothetical protein
MSVAVLPRAVSLPIYRKEVPQVSKAELREEALCIIVELDALTHLNKCHIIRAVRLIEIGETLDDHGLIDMGHFFSRRIGLHV